MPLDSLTSLATSKRRSFLPGLKMQRQNKQYNTSENPNHYSSAGNILAMINKKMKFRDICPKTFRVKDCLSKYPNSYTLNSSSDSRDSFDFASRKSLIHTETFTRIGNGSAGKPEIGGLRRKDKVVSRTTMEVSTRKESVSPTKESIGVDTSDLPSFIQNTVGDQGVPIISANCSIKPLNPKMKRMSEKVSFDPKNLDVLISKRPAETMEDPNNDAAQRIKAMQLYNVTLDTDNIWNMLKRLLNDLNVQRPETPSLKETSTIAEIKDLDCYESLSLQTIAPSKRSLTPQFKTQKKKLAAQGVKTIITKNEGFGDGNDPNSTMNSTSKFPKLKKVAKKSINDAKEVMFEVTKSSHVRVFSIDPFDNLIKSHLSPSDRRLTSISKKVNCKIQIKGPLLATNPNRPLSSLHNKLLYHCYLISESRVLVDKCLKCLNECFPSTRFMEISTPDPADLTYVCG